MQEMSKCLCARLVVVDLDYVEYDERRQRPGEQYMSSRPNASESAPCWSRQATLHGGDRARKPAEQSERQKVCGEEKIEIVPETKASVRHQRDHRRGA